MIYDAATLLNPAIRLEYLNNRWTTPELTDWKELSVENVKSSWELYYKESTPTKPQSQKQSFLDHFIKANDHAIESRIDQFDRYIHGTPVEFADDSINGRSLISWWDQCEFNQLRQMVFDILLIPAVSSEVERCFSSAKKLLRQERNRSTDPTIERLELLRNWMKRELV
jgi:hypothetical protein